MAGFYYYKIALQDNVNSHGRKFLTPSRHLDVSTRPPESRLTERINFAMISRGQHLHIPLIVPETPLLLLSTWKDLRISGRLHNEIPPPTLPTALIH